MIIKFLLSFLLCCSCLLGEDLLPVYLTWQTDPTTTMTIQWLSKPEAKEAALEYLKADETVWHKATGECQALPHKAPYNINRVFLQNLQPNAQYRFKIKDSEATHLFRTAPKELTEPFSFAVGGDVFPDDLQPFQEMTKQASLHNPRFVLLGGDLAYTASVKRFRQEDFDRWFTFLSVLSKDLKDQSGCLIPLLVTIGNHDVVGSYGQTPESAPFFYSLFAMPGIQGYNVLRFDNYLSLVLLDSGHTHPIAGAQTEWLNRELQKQGNVLHRFAAYHVAAFPSVRYYRQAIPTTIRRNWVPLFEKYGVQAVFENHDHAYKRTFPLISESHVPRGGVVYFGDGSWGVKPRIPKKASRTTYLATAQSVRQFLNVTVSKTKRQFKAITEKGVVIDEYEQVVD
ncbi:MAG: metallophosphoesterase family protein [Verrucomicrobia bacterium]|nr:metallophosphoesterase family protein [Verrucomicrobiota bacterium]